MRLTLFVLILTAIISGCSSTPSSFDFSLQSDSLDVAQKQHFKELDLILADHIESRDLVRAKHLVFELNKTIPRDHSRYKELVLTEQWINESLDYRTTVKLLEQQAQTLKSEIANHKQALEQVRRTLVAE